MAIAHLTVYYQYFCRNKGKQANMNLGRDMDMKMHGNTRIGRLLRASLNFDFTIYWYAILQHSG
jgi:hypothetical protein